MLHESHDWLGLCLDMMSEYLPVEVTTKDVAKKYWEINEHLICIMELSGLIKPPNTSQRADYLNNFLKDFISIFNIKVAEAAMSESDGANNFDNAMLNNILLLSLIGNSQDSELIDKIWFVDNIKSSVMNEISKNTNTQ